MRLNHPAEIIGVIFGIWLVAAGLSQLPPPGTDRIIFVAAVALSAFSIIADMKGLFGWRPTSAGDTNTGSPPQDGAIARGDKHDQASVTAEQSVRIEETIPSLPPLIPARRPQPPRLEIEVFGRDALKRDLLAELTPVPGRTVALTALHGMPGIGKSTLALWLANQPETKAAFPGGVLWTGLGPKPDVSAELGRWLIELGFDSTALRELPDVTERSAHLRNLLAGCAVLLVIDDVWDLEHALPFLATRGDACAALINGRSKDVVSALVGPDRVRSVELLTGDSALALLRNQAGVPAFDALAVPTGSDSTENSAPALAHHLDNLPLAIKLAGSEVRRRHTAGFSPAELLSVLHAEENRLLALQGRSKKDEQLTLGALVALSYAALPDDDSRCAFRRLAVLGSRPLDFDLAAAAGIWGCDQSQAAVWLQALIDAALLETIPGDSPRYTLHPVIHAFAIDALRECGEETAARLAHAVHYLSRIWTADGLFIQGGPALLRSLAIFDREWPHIQAGQAWAAAHAVVNDDVARLCSTYPDAAARILPLRLDPTDWIRWLEAALAAARSLGDRQAETNHLGNLGNAYHLLGQTQQAVQFYEQQLEFNRELGNRYGEGTNLGDLGVAYAGLGESRRAIQCYDRALPILREAHDRRTEATVLINLGVACAALGQTRRAIESYNRALPILQDFDDRRGESHVLGNLGHAYRSLGETQRAVEFYEQALAIDREIGDRRGEGADLGNLGSAFYLLGEPKRAIEYYEQSLAVHRILGDRTGEGDTWGGLGLAYAELGETCRAVECYKQWLAIARATGDRQAESRAAWNLGLIYAQLDNLTQAVPLMQACVDYQREINHPDVESNAARVANLRARLSAGQS